MQSKRLGLSERWMRKSSLLLAGMKQLETVKQTGIPFVAGEWLGKPVVCKSGVGKVNAAVTTQILIDHFQG